MCASLNPSPVAGIGDDVVRVESATGLAIETCVARVACDCVYVCVLVRQVVPNLLPFKSSWGGAAYCMPRDFLRFRKGFAKSEIPLAEVLGCPDVVCFCAVQLWSKVYVDNDFFPEVAAQSRVEVDLEFFQGQQDFLEILEHFFLEVGAYPVPVAVCEFVL